MDEHLYIYLRRETLDEMQCNHKMADSIEQFGRPPHGFFDLVQDLVGKVHKKHVNLSHFPLFQDSQGPLKNSRKGFSAGINILMKNSIYTFCDEKQRRKNNFVMTHSKGEVLCNTYYVYFRSILY